MSIVKVASRRVWHILKSQTLIGLNDNPFSTHIPILIAIAKIYKIRSVVEMGCGVNSTLTFLDRRAFPDLESLTSIENSREWFGKILDLTSRDARCTLKFCDDVLSSCVDDHLLRDCDLVFIDDGVNAQERVRTIRHVLSRRSKLVLIHDFENFPYRSAVRSVSSVYRFKALLPNTGVFGEGVDRAKMVAIDRIIGRNCRKLSCDDVGGWANLALSL